MPQRRKGLGKVGAVAIVAALMIGLGYNLAFSSEALDPDEAMRQFDAPACTADDKNAGHREPPTVDMYGTSEVRPGGAFQANGDWMTWALYPRVTLGTSPPAGWPTMVAWGQVFIAENGTVGPNTRVEVRRLRLFVRPRKTGRWCLLIAEDAPHGGLFETGFAGNTHIKGDQRVESGGGRSFLPVANKAIHFYTRHAPIPAEGLTGVYADFQARLVKDKEDGPDGRSSSVMVASAGADYKAVAYRPSPPETLVVGEVGIGRFRHVGSEWKTFTMNATAPGVRRKIL